MSIADAMAKDQNGNEVNPVVKKISYYGPALKHPIVLKKNPEYDAELDRKSAKFVGTVPSGKILVDGYGVGDVGNIVLRDRRHLAQDGLIVVVASIDIASGLVLSGPEIISRGFVYVRESEELMDEARQIAADAINGCLNLNSRKTPDRMELKAKLRDELTKFLYAKTKRKPMVLPVIMDA
jgi:ribonuclease J